MPVKGTTNRLGTRRWVSLGLLIGLLGLGLVLASHGIAASSASVPRPAKWATAVQEPGLPNCFKVSDVLYRGAQPTREGFVNLRKMGIRTVVNLREQHSDRALIEGLGLRYESIPMGAWSPRREDFLRFLAIVRDPARQPVFVHCQHGSDRTGTAVALYRVVVEGWDREEAIREMTAGGYGFHWIYFNLKSFVREFSLP
jgi:protein tyrosine phosphatase (PTP) superfamily phosphohydrolase (DUF442 family)